MCLAVTHGFKVQTIIDIKSIFHVIRNTKDVIDDDSFVSMVYKFSLKFNEI